MPVRKVLIVDDSKTELMFLTDLLQKNGMFVKTAEGADEAFRRLAEDKPDLILMDVVMPDMNGFEVCRIIKADVRYEGIPIIFITSANTPKDELTGIGLGGTDYLTKPLDFELLKLKTHNHIELKLRNDTIRDQRDQLALKNQELEAAMVRIRRLEGLLPICLFCKSIHRDDASWQELEVYISEHSDAQFSHGICPACFKKHYPDIPL